MSIHQKMIQFHKAFNGAKKTGVNPHFNSVHFTLDDITRAVTPALNELGLYISHRQVLTDGQLLCVASITDEEGDCIESVLPIPQSQNPQVVGSALTYFRRYNICALLNIAEADDDGNASAAVADDATPDQLATIKDFEDAGQIPEITLQWLKSHPHLTGTQATKLIEKLKEEAA